MAIDFKEIYLAFEFVSFGGPDEHQAYIDKETGKIYWHSEFGDNEEEMPDDIFSDKYVEVPHKSELGLGKPLVLRFANECIPSEFDRIQTIFSKRGAYSKFKDSLEKNGIIEQWYEYENNARESALRVWCKENDLQIVG